MSPGIKQNVQNQNIVDDSKKFSVLKKGNRDRKLKRYGNKIEIKETSWRMETS